MALTIEIQVSTTGIADSAFGPLTSFADTGAAFSFDHAPVVPNQLYIYRARRRDSNQAGTACEYSAWSPYVFSRAPYEVIMSSIDDINTGSETQLWIGLEAQQGVPAKAVWSIEYISGTITKNIQRLYSKSLKNRSTERRKAVPGRAEFEGSFVVEVTPEGGFPRLLLAALAVSTTPLSNPTRYRHRFYNDFTTRTFTLYQRVGPVIYCAPGCSVTSLEISTSKEQDSVLEATFNVMALDTGVFELGLVPNAPTLLGTATASEDASLPYSPVDATGRIANVVAGVKTLQVTATPAKARNNVLDGFRGANKLFNNGATGTSASATLNFGTTTNLRRDLLGSTVPVGAYAVGQSIAVVPVSLTFDPPANAQGFSNRLAIVIPNSDVKTAQPVDGEGPIPENLTFMPMDVPGDPANTDLYIELDNSESFASLTTPAPTVVTFPSSRALNFNYGVASGVPTTTVIQSASQHLSSVDGVYVGQTLIFIGGAQNGQSAVISAYVGATRQFTLATPLPAAPVAGDTFTVNQ